MVKNGSYKQGVFNKYIIQVHVSNILNNMISP